MPMHDDRLLRFFLPEAGVRGALVRLGASWREVAGRQDYPPALRTLLGESLAAAALMTANIKYEGSLSLQLKGEGDVRLLFAECTDGGDLRGLVRWDEDASFAAQAALPKGVLAITIGHAEGARYQGLVTLDAPNLGAALEHWFDASEQLPTHLVLGADGEIAAGLLLQRMPTEGGHAAADGDAWERIGHLAATLGAAELIAIEPPTLLRRLFHQEVLEFGASTHLAFGCSCSRQRVAEVLRSLGREEVDAALEASAGRIEVDCEFCAAHYVFDSVDASALFNPGAAGESARVH